MKNERYKYPPSDVFNIREIEAWLEKMAAEGLLLKEAGAYAWRFEEGEPKSVRYRIDPAVEKKGRLDSERNFHGERGDGRGACFFPCPVL